MVTRILKILELLNFQSIFAYDNQSPTVISYLAGQASGMLWPRWVPSTETHSPPGKQRTFSQTTSSTPSQIAFGICSTSAILHNRLNTGTLHPKLSFARLLVHGPICSLFEDIFQFLSVLLLIAERRPAMCERLLPRKEGMSYCSCFGVFLGTFHPH